MITRKKRSMLILSLLAVLIALDHATKLLAIVYLKESGDVHIFLGDLFRLQYAENTGAFLSLGAGLPTSIRALVMIGINSVILVCVLAYLFIARTLPLLHVLAFTCVAGGGIGNLIDRIFRDGRVVDFMNMGINLGNVSLRTGIFNIADIAIMAGLFLIIVNEVVAVRKHHQNTDDKKASRPPKKN